MKTTIFFGLGQESKVTADYSALRQALESIRNQTVPVYLIVFDWAHDSQAVEMTKQYTDNIYSLSGYASHKESNAILREEATEYILPFCADDILHPFYCEYAQSVLDHSPEYDIVLPDHLVFGKENRYWKQDGLVPAIMSGNTMFNSSVYRKSLFEYVGGYDETMPHRGWEDWDFWVKCYQAGAKVFRAGFPFMKYRVHDANFSNLIIPHSQEIIDYMKSKGHHV